MKALPKGVSLRKDWLHGLPGYYVYDAAGKKLGFVLKESMGPEWAAVWTESPHYDEFDSLVYDFKTRAQAIKALIDNP
jgi:hypothetical protein